MLSQIWVQRLEHIKKKHSEIIIKKDLTIQKKSHQRAINFYQISTYFT